MADDTKAEVVIGAQIAELKAGMDEAAGKVQQSLGQMQGGLKQMEDQSKQSTNAITNGFKQMHADITSTVAGITSTITKIGEVALGIGAVLAGGALFKGVIDKFVEMNLEAKRLSGQMGVSVQEAAAFIQANNRLGVSTETVSTQMKMFERNSRANEDALVAMGAKVGVNINLQDGLEKSYLKTIEALGKYKEGHDRNQAAIDAFGGRVQITNAQLRLNAEVVDEADKHLKSLGLTFDDLSAAKARAFKEGMHDVELVFDAVKYKIGAALIPVLIQLGHFFAELGPSVIGAMSQAIQSFQDFLMQATVVASNIRVAWEATWDILGAGAAAVKQRLMETCGTDVVGAFAAGMAAMKNSLADWREQAIRDSNDVRFALMNAQPAIAAKGPDILGALESKGKATPKGGATHDDKDTGGKGGGGGPGLLQQWKDELDQLKMEENKYLDFSKQAEREFWQSKLAMTSQGSKEYLAVRKEIFNLDKALAKDAAQDALAEMNRQMTSEKTNQAAKRALMTQEVAFVKEKWGEQSREYRAVLQKQAQFDEEDAKFKRDLAARQIDDKAKLAQMDLSRQEQQIKFEEQMGMVSAKTALDRLRQLKAQELEIERKAITDKMEIFKKDEKQQEILAQQLETFKQKKLKEEEKAVQQAALQNKQAIASFLAPIQSAIETSITGIIQGTTTLKKALDNLFQSILTSFVGTLAKMAQEWISNQLMMLIFGKTTAEGVIATDAGRAGAAAAMSVFESVPFPENVALAPEVGAAAAALVMGFGAVASAAGGWDVPHDAFTMVHAKEMILPADLSDRIRTMTSPGAGGGEGGGEVHHHTHNWNINNMDGASLKKLFMNEGEALAHSVNRVFDRHGKAILGTAYK